MSQQPPLVTIGVPVYNGEEMLGDMLASLEAQTFERFKVVICDNASTDRTPEIAQAFCARDTRFTYHRNPENIGAHPNFNRVWDIDHSTPYYKWAAHDDIYAPTHLERCVEVLEWEPDVVASYPITVMVDETGRGRAAEEMGLTSCVLESLVDEQGRAAWVIGPLHLTEGDDPVRRLRELLLYKHGGFEIFSVIRVSALEQTQLHASYYGCDRPLLSHLVLLGRFKQVPERLYFNRFHKAASRHLTRSQQRQFVDTRGSTRWANAQMYLDILRATGKASLNLRTRTQCILVILLVLMREQGARAGRVVRRLIGGQLEPDFKLATRKKLDAERQKPAR